MYLAEKYNKFYEVKDTHYYKSMVNGTSGNNRTNAWTAPSISSL